MAGTDVREPLLHRQHQIAGAHTDAHFGIECYPQQPKITLPGIIMLNQANLDFRSPNDTTVMFCRNKWSQWKDYPFFTSDIYDSLSDGVHKGAFNPALPGDSMWIADWTALAFYNMLKPGSAVLRDSLPEKMLNDGVAIKMISNSGFSEKLSVWRNNGYLKIMLPRNATGDLKLDVHDPAGRLVKTIKNTTFTDRQTMMIPVSSLTRGMYILRISSESLDVRKNVIIH
ncbi:MAG: T9SS type A sorting domain-containing protein [Chitinivibrionales bacterium]|nr:T9SS type A sorting domain-containing protein [Chitinivibrionales bacterium]